MPTDRPLIGIFLMLGFCIVAPLADSIAKLMSAFPLLVLLTVRFGIQAVVLFPLALGTRQKLWWTPRITRLVALRTGLHIVGIGLMFSALRYLPLADAVAIAFVMPFILLLLGRLVLAEEVGPRRIAACGVGFLGTLCVVQPSFAEVGAPALLPLGVAVVFALFMLVTRQIARQTDPVAMQCTSGAMALVLLVPLLAVSDLSEMAAADQRDLLLFVALGLLGTVGHLLMTWSLRFAPASTLAPMQYLEIPCAAVLGWLIFHEFPNALALFGIAITIASGLYIVWRESRISRATAQPVPPAKPPVAG
ncbi:MAG: DMT family transporter [Pseudomonadota bacterium]